MSGHAVQKPIHHNVRRIIQNVIDAVEPKLPHILFSSIAAMKLRRIIRDIQNNDVEGVLNVLYSFNYRGVKLVPIQQKDELRQFLKIVAKRKPCTVLEIGTAYGGTLFPFTMLAASDATIITVDLPRFYMRFREPILRSFIRYNQRMHLLRMNSHHQTTRDRILRILSGKLVDLLFIDGDHSYRGVKQDFEMYSSLVKHGGIIALHDISTTEWAGVVQFWREIKVTLNHQEIIGREHYGIGVIYV